MSTEENENSGGEEGNSAPAWMIDDSIPGVGPRPEWLPEKYKSMKDAMTSNAALEKKMGLGTVSEYDFGDFAGVFDKDHASIKELTAFAKENHISQDVFSKFIGSISKYGESLVPNDAAIKAELGADADKRLETLNNWVEANLSGDSAKALTENLNSVATIKAMEEIRSKMLQNNSTIPNGTEGSEGSSETVAELQDEISKNYDKFKTDPVYQKDWRRRLSAASRNSGYVDKQGA